MFLAAASDGFVAFEGPVARRRTVRPEMVNGFAVAHAGVGDAAIAVPPGIGLRGGCNGEGEKSAERNSGDNSLAKK